MSNVVRFQREKIYQFNCENGHRFYLPFVFPMDLIQVSDFCKGVTCPSCQVEYKKIKMSTKPLEVVE